jgi:GNAT superfamily N-acetyltransferase
MFKNKVYVSESESEWKDVEKYCNENKNEIVIYYELDNSQGYISYTVWNKDKDNDVDRDIVIINKLFVRKGCRKKGVGTFLIGKIPSCKRLAVEPIDTHNFYLKNGFVYDKNYKFWMVKCHHKYQTNDQLIKKILKGKMF